MSRSAFGMFCVLICYIVSVRSMDPSIDFESATISRSQKGTTTIFRASNYECPSRTTSDGKPVWNIVASYRAAEKTYAGMRWDHTRPDGDQHVQLGADESERYFNSMKPLWEQWHKQWVKDCSLFDR